MNNLVGNQSKKNQLIKKSFLKEYSTYGTNKIEKSENDEKKKTDTVDAIKIDDLNFDKKIDEN